jgi:hypothetical protein
MTTWSAIGLAVHRTVYDTDGVHRDRTDVVVPFWLLTLAAAALAANQLVSAVRRHRRRAAQGACRHCGCDLRATPERCPECGTIRKR